MYKRIAIAILIAAPLIADFAARNAPQPALSADRRLANTPVPAPPPAPRPVAAVAPPQPPVAELAEPGVPIDPTPALNPVGIAVGPPGAPVTTTPPVVTSTPAADAPAPETPTP